MLQLLLASLVWAFSFGLIKGQLAGLDPTAVAVLRLLCALLVFLPFFRRPGLTRRLQLHLAAIGAVQFGLMYVLYLRAFAALQAHEVALFTILTPIYLALLDAAVEHRWQPRHLAAAVLSLAGAGALLWRSGVTTGALGGFLLVQLSNLCFAAGQLAYKRLHPQLGARADSAVFALPYAGALAATLLASFVFTDWTAFRPGAAQLGVVAYLGIVASGLGFFWWNLGATRVNTGTLAVFNNAKIPLGIAVSLLCFGESANLPRLLLSLALMFAAVAVAEGWFMPRIQESGARSPE